MRFIKVKNIELSMVELEKMLNVLLLRRAKGYSQYELSFLLGQRDFYVRDIENPAHKLDYKVYFANVLRQVFDCPIDAIVPNTNSTPSYSINLFQHDDGSDNITYKAEKVHDDGTKLQFPVFGKEEKHVVLPSQSSISANEVMGWVLHQCERNYFEIEKTALELLKDCTEAMSEAVRPLYLAQALHACNGTKGLPKIIRQKNKNKSFVYHF